MTAGTGGGARKGAGQQDEPATSEIQFEAFKHELIVDRLPAKIGSVCLWAEHVLAGLHDGRLLFIRRAAPGTTSPSGTAWQVG